MTIKKLTAASLKTIKTDVYQAEEWADVITFFWDRYNKRYFNPIYVLQHHSDFEIRNNCGFLITTIDCILIETIEQYYTGSDETKGSTQNAFYSFFKRSKALNGVIKDVTEAGIFAGFIRSGLLHQSKTKKSSLINKKMTTPIMQWIDSARKTKGFLLNREKFHQAVVDEYTNLIEALKMPENEKIRIEFIKKLSTVIE